MIRVEFIDELKRNRQSAKNYINELKSKRFKTIRVRKALDYWEGNYDAFDRALFLAQWYSESKEREGE